eukprot:m.146983 g.146983  ORF g.146983 m.146983 type:complete len:175 (-) comp17273_c0_seq2:23-547(-)
MTMRPSQAALLLMKQLKELNKSPISGFSAGLVDDDDPFKWEVMVSGPPDTLYEGGMFKAMLNFPKDYPMSPPQMKFVSEMWHPNIYTGSRDCGKVCISILHPPGDDPHNYESASERWSPVHTVESILLSVMSMLASPNDESPANIDAAKEWRESPDEFKKHVRRTVRKSQDDLY